MWLYFTVFLMKFADCSLSTLKTVFLVKNKFFISSIMNSLSAALFIFVADAMANSQPDQKMLIAACVFFANLTGGYIPPKFIDKMEQDRLFVYVVTSPTFDSGTIFADKIRELNIPVSTTISYDKKLNKVLTCKIYSSNRKESKIVESYLTNDYKYHVIEAL